MTPMDDTEALRRVVKAARDLLEIDDSLDERYRNHDPADHEALRQALSTLALNAARDYCAKRGTEEGKGAASWVFDGNTTRATYVHVLKGLDDGDPAVLNTLPSADLSGEMADTTTGPSLVKDALTEVGINDVDDETYQAWFDDLCTAYEDAFNEAVHHEVERVARYQLEDES